MKTDTLAIVEKQKIKEYGATGAIIIQAILDNCSEHPVELEVDKWCSTFLWYMEASTVKSYLTKLSNAGRIEIVDDLLYLTEAEKPVYKEEPIIKVRREHTEIQKMVEVLQKDIYKENTELVPWKRHLRFAKSLLAQGITTKQMKEWYGDKGLWYANEWKGQKGSPPNQSDISRTIDSFKSNKTAKGSSGGKQSIWGNI